MEVYLNYLIIMNNVLCRNILIARIVDSVAYKVI